MMSSMSGSRRIPASGTTAAGANISLFWQFGVGFYSAFLVSDRVTVVTKSSDGPQLRWESESANKYTISEDDSEVRSPTI